MGRHFEQTIRAFRLQFTKTWTIKIDTHTFPPDSAAHPPRVQTLPPYIRSAPCFSPLPGINFQGVPAFRTHYRNLPLLRAHAPSTPAFHTYSSVPSSRRRFGLPENRISDNSHTARSPRQAAHRNPSKTASRKSSYGTPQNPSRTGRPPYIRDMRHLLCQTKARAATCNPFERDKLLTLSTEVPAAAAAVNLVLIADKNRFIHDGIRDIGLREKS